MADKVTFEHEDMLECNYFVTSVSNMIDYRVSIHSPILTPPYIVMDATYAFAERIVL